MVAGTQAGAGGAAAVGRRARGERDRFFFSSRRRHTRFDCDWIQTCALPILGAICSAPAVRFQSLVRTCGQNGHMETVLVVDDEPTIRDVVVQYLRREGFATLEAGDGDAARELLEREWPSLVVLDLMLPGTDGLALCRWIRDRSQLPVIMLTARGEEADRIVGLELGADDYVTKPFSPRELVARVRTVLRRGGAANGPPEERV